MTQPIAGVSPSNLQETTVMTVWPSVAMFGLGRMLGQAYSINAGIYVLTVGNLIALASIPLALVLYFARILPPLGVRYRLTNRRLIVETALTLKEVRSVELDRFDAIDVHVLPGQGWYSAGDLVFRLGNIETFRLSGVSRPLVFKSICWKAHLSNVGVKKAVKLEPVAV